MSNYLFICGHPPTSHSKKIARYLEIIIVVSVLLVLVFLPIAYSYTKKNPFLEADYYLWLLSVLLGLTGLIWQLLATGSLNFYITQVQGWGLALVALTGLLHKLIGVPDVSHVVLLLVLGLVWPSVASVAVRSRLRPWVEVALGLVLLGQGVLAAYQFAMDGAHRSLAVTGTLFNAGSLGNYLALALPWLLSIVTSAYQTINNKSNTYFLHYKYLFYLLVTGCVMGVLLLTGARAAWLGALTGIAFVLSHYVSLRLLIRNSWLTNRLSGRAGSWLLVGSVIGVGLWALVNFKLTSVYGRWQIYTIGVELFAQHPLLGIGWGRTTSQFNEQQAVYFATHTVPVARQLLASDTYVLFNSLLQLGVEAGLFGVAAWLAGLGFLWSIVRRSYQEAWSPNAVGAVGGLLSIGVSSLFSYPFQVLPTIALAGLLLAFLPARKLPQATRWSRASRVVGGSIAVLLLLGLGYKQGQRWRALLSWQRAAILANQGEFGQALPLYERARTELAEHGPFLYNYGVEAGFASEHTRSLSLLEAARPYYTSSALYSFLGQAYEETGQMQRATWCFQHASYMVPSYFYPRYQLFELYRRTGQQRQAHQVGTQLLAYPVKIDTDLTRQIKYRVAQSLGLGLQTGK